MGVREMHYLTGPGNARVSFLAPEVYDDIAEIVGVNKLEDDDTDRGIFMPRSTELVRQGLAIKMRIRYDDGEIRYSTIYCDIDRAPTAVSSLRGKTFNGGTIRSASVPRRRRLG